MYDKENDIERIFNDDSRGKKKVGNNVSKRASRKGYCRGGVKFPSDYLSAKEKRKLNGRIIMSNIYEDINKLPTWDEMKKMDSDKAKNIITIARKYHAPTELQRHFGINAGSLYGLLAKLGVYIPQTRAQRRSAKVLKDKRVYRNIESVPTYDDFLDLDLGERIRTLTQIKKDVSVASLRKHWRISSGSLYKYLYQYGVIPYNGNDKGIKMLIDDSREVVDNIKNNVAAVDLTKEVQEDIKEEVEIIEEPKALETELKVVDSVESSKITKEPITEIIAPVINNNFSMSMNGIFTRQQIESKLFMLLATMEHGKEYNIEINIKE